MTNVSPQRFPTIHVASTNNGQSGNSTAILGIWRLGSLLHRSPTAELNLTQPADSVGSPRWDYVIKRAIGEDVESRRQINQFVAAASTIVHPNLVAVLDASNSSTTPYVVMPRLDGVTMQAHLDATDRKPLPVALWLVRQVAQALDALHSAGWIHGDVKPENTIVGSRGHVTLVDLGFACRIHTVAGSHFRGTPAYSAPETMSGNHAALPSADVFSLGRILWKWLTHTHPTNRSTLEPIADLVESMVSDDMNQRPTAGRVAKQLLKLEIETLGQHIGPADGIRRAA
ncbi:Serine/threonine-protein kinase PK-1 [Rubripirellula tenax]|uniref:Serine/threonine-protein kinase PK-1 n=1 Tax=Rubripirellula tenax TaxID=2528015 RepID=A0A5C6ERK9_9BACT|nr:protein kinase [Rubripirellula tenax]TWU50950.1 Serine/threonine-protein kinase PK-1 [Rubripirellula tenax]